MGLGPSTNQETSIKQKKMKVKQHFIVTVLVLLAAISVFQLSIEIG